MEELLFGIKSVLQFSLNRVFVLASVIAYSRMSVVYILPAAVIPSNISYDVDSLAGTVLHLSLCFGQCSTWHFLLQ